MSNSTFESRRSTLIAEITSAFDGVSRGNGITLHEARAMDNYASPQEQRAARLYDTERRWQDVPDADIVDCCSALSFLDKDGFRYYLPAFMIYSLKHWGDDWERILSTCEFHLLQDYPKSLRQSEPEAIAEKYQFTPAQCKAIASFLRFIIDFDEARATQVTVKAVVKWEKFAQSLSGV